MISRIVAVVALTIIAVLGAGSAAYAAPKDPKPSICERQPDKNNCPRTHGKNAQPTTYTVTTTVTTQPETDSVVTVVCDAGDTYVPDSLRTTNDPETWDGYNLSPRPLDDGSGVVTGTHYNGEAGASPPVTSTFTITCRS